MRLVAGPEEVPEDDAAINRRQAILTQNVIDDEDAPVIRIRVDERSGALEKSHTLVQVSPSLTSSKRAASSPSLSLRPVGSPVMRSGCAFR